MSELTDLIQEYYAAHQISKSLNILKLANEEEIPWTSNITKCVTQYFEPVDGWDKKITSSSGNDKCYYCLMQMKSMFKGFGNNTPNSCCDKCYMNMIHEYVRPNSKVRLNKKFVRKMARQK